MYKINENTMGSMKHIPFQYQMSRFIKTAADFKMPSARYFRNYKATILFVNSLSRVRLVLNFVSLI